MLPSKKTSIGRLSKVAKRQVLLSRVAHGHDVKRPVARRKRAGVREEVDAPREVLDPLVAVLHELARVPRRRVGEHVAHEVRTCAVALEHGSNLVRIRRDAPPLVGEHDRDDVRSVRRQVRLDVARHVEGQVVAIERARALGRAPVRGRRGPTSNRVPASPRPTECRADPKAGEGPTAGRRRSGSWRSAARGCDLEVPWATDFPCSCSISDLRLRLRRARTLSSNGGTTFRSWSRACVPGAREGRAVPAGPRRTEPARRSRRPASSSFATAGQPADWHGDAPFEMSEAHAARCRAWSAPPRIVRRGRAAPRCNVARANLRHDRSRRRGSDTRREPSPRCR